MGSMGRTAILSYSPCGRFPVLHCPRQIRPTTKTRPAMNNHAAIARRQFRGESPGSPTCRRQEGRSCWPLCLVSWLCCTMMIPAVGAQTRESVQERGRLVCGVEVDLQGFSTANSLGEYSGFDIDLCRAVASAVLDDPMAVDFQATAWSDGWRR